MSKHHRLRPVALLLAVAGFLAACGSSGSSSASGSAAASTSGPSVSVAFGYQSTSWGAPIVVAQKMNAWKGLGVNVNTTALTAGTAVTQGILSGSLQAGSLGSTPFITGAAKGKLVAVAVVAYAGATDAVVARNGSGITSVADLRGKKIATQIGSSTNDIFVNKIAPANGLQPGSYTLVNTTFQNMYSELAAGDVDAFLGVDPSPALATYNKVGTIVTTYLKYDPTPLYLTFTQQFVQSHPNAVVRFLEGWLKVDQEFAKHPAQAATLSSAIFATTGVQLPTKVLQESVSAMQVTSAFASNTDQYLTAQAETLVKQGAIPAVPNWSQAINTSFLKKAAKAIGVTLTPPKLQ
jgi:ABC-type nitrate/sulfonate/bicarbonate transport system substrate-binding protein